MLRHLSLFSGIGGLDLAAEWAGVETVGQCEFADYPTKVLEKHWPNVPRWRDMRDVTIESVRDRGIERVDIISGGFPCQPHSLAGKRLSSCDERDLWPEYKRVVSEIKPRWVVAENVWGLLSSENGRFFRGILRDFAGMGFNVGWLTYPASWVGAIHRRARVFIVANSNRERRGSMGENKQNQRGTVFTQEPYYPEGGAWLDAEAAELLHSGERALYFEGGVNLRNDNGLSEGIHRLTCLGNAVMPQQAYPIFKAIMEIERRNEK